MMKLIRAFLSYFCGGAVIFGLTAGSLAAAARNVSLAGPYFNPETKSYFQLFRHPDRGSRGYTWKEANAQATRKFYKGERGRLARVKIPKTLKFVREKFSFKGATWIGARYFCKISKVLWVDGESRGPKATGMWHKKWYRSDIQCGKVGYMPIYVTAPETGGVFWQASGPRKKFYYYLVEFPAVKKSGDVSQNSKETTEPAEASTTQ